MKAFFAVASVLSVCASSVYAQNLPVSLLDKKISMVQFHPSLSSVLFELAEKSDVNIVSDSYLTDTVADDLIAKDIKVKIIIDNIKRIFGRESELQNGILLFREKNWQLRSPTDRAMEKALKDKKEGVIFEKTEESTDSDNTPKSVLNKNRKITVLAKRVRIEELLSVISRQVGWKIKADSSVAGRRLTVVLRDVPVEQALMAITTVIESVQTVTIGKSESQLAAEKSVFTDDPVEDAIKESSEILPLLYECMDEKQRASMEKGDQIYMKISDLPSVLKNRCERYIEMSLKMMLKSNVKIPFDRNRFSDASVNVLPSSNQRRVGVSIFGTDGNLHTF